MNAFAPFQSKSTVSVRTPNNQPIAVDNYGQLEMTGMRIAILSITHTFEHPDERTFVGIMDGKKQLIPKKELRKGQHRYFECRYDLQNEGQAYANSLRMVRVNKGGEYAITEIGITMQAGKIFLTRQVIYEGICYNDAGCMVIPRFEEPWVQEHWHVNPWPVMADRLRLMLDNLGVSADDLPCITDFVPPVIEHPVRDNEGVVVHFNNLKGYGVVRTNRCLAYVSYREIVAPGCRFKRLNPGDRVIYTRRVETEGLGYPATLYGVRLVA